MLFRSWLAWKSAWEKIRGPAICISSLSSCEQSLCRASLMLPPISNCVSNWRRTEYIVAKSDLESHGGSQLSSLLLSWMLCCAHLPTIQATKTTSARCPGLNVVESPAESIWSSVGIFFQAPFRKVISSHGSCTRQCASAIAAGLALPHEQSLSRI